MAEVEVGDRYLLVEASLGVRLERVDPDQYSAAVTHQVTADERAVRSDVLQPGSQQQPGGTYGPAADDVQTGLDDAARPGRGVQVFHAADLFRVPPEALGDRARSRSEEHTSELQSPCNLVCRLLLEKKKKNKTQTKQHHTP